MSAKQLDTMMQSARLESINIRNKIIKITHASMEAYRQKRRILAQSIYG